MSKQVRTLIIVLAVILTFNLDVQFGFVLLCAVAAVLILALFIMRSASPLFRKLQKLLDRMSKILLENITGVRVVRAFNNEQREETRLNHSRLMRRHPSRQTGCSPTWMVSHSSSSTCSSWSSTG